jgi:serine protease AprX
MTKGRSPKCPHCQRPTGNEVLGAVRWLPRAVQTALDGSACPVCAQRTLHGWLVARAEMGGPHGAHLFDHHRLLPFSVFPVPYLIGMNSTFQGRGVTMALIDSGFFPHPDVVGDSANSTQTACRVRLRAWADASVPRVRFGFFHPLTPPRWPGWSRRAAEQWHGTMTAGVAAGTGSLSHGWFRGVASACDLVFVQTWADGRITNASLTRALHWLLRHRQRLRLRVVNISVYGDPVKRLRGNRVDAAVQRLVDDGVVVIVAAGNSGRPELLPPATAAAAITVGGFDPQNSPDPVAWRLWHSDWGTSSRGTPKPDLLAPANWLPAPILPGSPLADEAMHLFDQRATGDPSVESRIAQQKLIAPHYQHVDGTSFAAAIVAGTVACMLEAHPDLTPEAVRGILRDTAQPLPHVPEAKQGAGVIRPMAAIEKARALHIASLSSASSHEPT